ncbi:MAG: hypothetical protein ACRED9_00980 [Caulobacteraceae bacterium]
MIKRLIATAAVLSFCLASAPASASARCGAQPITAGYGANGVYGIETEHLVNPGDENNEMTVYFPQGVAVPRPVVFFAHGFGPGLTATYADLIKHIVSKGYVVVFSTYPMMGVSIGDRYDSLWRGFAAAAARFHSRMDLSRVAFIGHSFGGGAVPAMAHEGLVEKGWGRKGAFLMELAPWYSFQITRGEFAKIPAAAAQFVEVYDKDNTNDHRIAIHLYDDSHAKDRYFFLVRSDDTCGFTANHSTPGRNGSLIQKEYAIFRPFDALAALEFDADEAARGALEKMGEPSPEYQPLRLLPNPTPDRPESYYRWPWDDSRNPYSL